MNNTKFKNLSKSLSRVMTLIMLLAAFSLSLTSCDNKNSEPIDDNTVDYKQTYDFISEIILDENGQLWYTPSGNTPGLYVFPVENAEQSLAICEGFIDRVWNGENTNVSLGEYGTISLRKSTEEGVFHEISFNLQGLPSFTLNLGTLQYCLNENMRVPDIPYSVRYVCVNCKKQFKDKPKKCDKCGGTSFKTITSNRVDL